MRPSSQLKSWSADSIVAQDDNWMLSYIDVFVLITTMFLMLMVMNKSDFGSVDHVEAETDSLHIAQNQTTGLPELIDTNDLNHHVKEPALYGVILDSISRHELDNHVIASYSEGAVRLEIQSQVLFDSGDAYLTRSGVAVLDRLSPILADTKGEIIIEGHTDNQPIKTRQHPSNWSLAAARAAEVLAFFAGEGIQESRFRAVSYGETRPIADNADERGRRKNRRVSLVIEQTTSP